MNECEFRKRDDRKMGFHHREKIKPCPFCKVEQEQYPDEDQFEYRGFGPPPGYAVVCYSCGAQGPMGTGMERDDHYGGKCEAIRKWNEAHND